jgi:glycosyltransferase involved in cell wall biosynthesis
MSYAPNGSNMLLDRETFTRNETNSPQQKNFKIPKRRPSAPKRNRRSTSPDAASLPPIIVHCHLCWDWVWQRPQQFVSRLSRWHKILFVETLAPDPCLSSPLARFRSPEQFPNITILQIQFPLWRWNDGKYVDRTRRKLVQDFVQGPGAGQFEKPVQWFYDPMTVTAFAGQMGEVLTVYDCMDELSQFRGAPPDMAAREEQLLSVADVVFTGGRKLYESKRESNPNCHFYGCGVEVDHFGKALAAEMKVPDDLARLPKPILGYFGVVDERMDYELIRKLARANPHWSVAMIGPSLKVDAAALPQERNLHWLGPKNYSDLPAYCKGFDLCLMPFALNESTEFINPTKALEYMASGRQIVSTAISDVIRNFGSVVKVADGDERFISLCREALAQPDRKAVNRGIQMAQQNSWDSVVDRLEGHLAQALLVKSTVRAAA